MDKRRPITAKLSSRRLAGPYDRPVPNTPSSRGDVQTDSPSDSILRRVRSLFSPRKWWTGQTHEHPAVDASETNTGNSKSTRVTISSGSGYGTPEVKQKSRLNGSELYVDEDSNQYTPLYPQFSPENYKKRAFEYPIPSPPVFDPVSPLKHSPLHTSESGSPNQRLAEFFLRKGDEDLNEVETEGVLSLIRQAASRNQSLIDIEEFEQQNSSSAQQSPLLPTPIRPSLIEDNIFSPNSSSSSTPLRSAKKPYNYRRLSGVSASSSPYRPSPYGLSLRALKKAQNGSPLTSSGLSQGAVTKQSKHKLDAGHPTKVFPKAEKQLSQTASTLLSLINSFEKSGEESKPPKDVKKDVSDVEEFINPYALQPVRSSQRSMSRSPHRSPNRSPKPPSTSVSPIRPSMINYLDKSTPEKERKASELSTDVMTSTAANGVSTKYRPVRSSGLRKTLMPEEIKSPERTKSLDNPFAFKPASETVKSSAHIDDSSKGSNLFPVLQAPTAFSPSSVSPARPLFGSGTAGQSNDSYEAPKFKSLLSKPEPFSFKPVGSESSQPEVFTFKPVKSGTSTPEPFTFNPTKSGASTPEPFTFKPVTSETPKPAPFIFKPVESDNSKPAPFTFKPVTTETPEPSPFTFKPVESDTSDTTKQSPFSFTPLKSGAISPENVIQAATSSKFSSPFKFGSSDVERDITDNSYTTLGSQDSSSDLALKDTDNQANQDDADNSDTKMGSEDSSPAPGDQDSQPKFQFPSIPIVPAPTSLDLSRLSYLKENMFYFKDI